MTGEKLIHGKVNDDEGGIEMIDRNMSILRDHLMTLLEEIPGGPPNIDGDPDEEIAVAERYLKTLRSLLSTMAPREWERANKLKTDIGVLEKVLKYLEEKKHRQEMDEKILNGSISG